MLTMTTSKHVPAHELADSQFKYMYLPAPSLLGKIVLVQNSLDEMRLLCVTPV